MDNKITIDKRSSGVPLEIKGWNWGAFLLSWIWGVGNNTYRAFWVFLPIVNLFVVVILGLKGNEWAWQNRRWDSIEHFKSVQRRWTIAGFIFWSIVILLFISLFFLVTTVFKNSEPFKLSFSMVSKAQPVIEALGAQIEAGVVSGKLNVAGSQGEADLVYDIKGPSGTGKVILKANKNQGKWVITCLKVFINGSSPFDIALVDCDFQTMK